jgi:hypothetical protein
VPAFVTHQDLDGGPAGAGIAQRLTFFELKASGLLTALNFVS